MGKRREGRVVPRRVRRVPARTRHRAASIDQRHVRDRRVQTMNVDYENLERDIATGMFREMLREELIGGFRQIQASGERLPAASHYASQIAEIVRRGAAAPLPPESAVELYQDILEAVEAARALVPGQQQAQ